MAPKKHNGFMMFVNNWRSLKPENRSCSISEAVSRCGTIWKNMTEQQRGPYNSAAKDADVSERCKRERLNCQGQSVSSVEREEREAANELQLMKRNIERSVMDGKKAHDFENTKFVFVAFNYFTKSANTQIYMPAEFAACEYSLKSGVNSIYSSMINPGTSIFGQGCDAMHHSTTTHQLPLPPNALGESDLGKLYSGIIEYLRKSLNNTTKPLVVYTTTDMMTMVRSCFRYLETALDDDDFDQPIIVYDIQYLFYVLKKEAMDIAGIVDEKLNIFVTDAFFIKDFFEYQAGIACEFHEENDRGKYCTKSMVTRWGYTFSDYICGALAIKLIPGKHTPPTLKSTYRVTNPTPPVSKDVTFSSFYSFDSGIKKEGVSSSEASVSPPESRQSSFSAYVPGDHTAFAGNLRGNDFPSLGGGASGSRKPKSKRTPATAETTHHHGSAVPEHMMGPWTFQRKNQAVDEDAFEVFANTSNASKTKKAAARA